MKKIETKFNIIGCTVFKGERVAICKHKKEFRIVSLEITQDYPNIYGRVYPAQVVEKAVRDKVKHKGKLPK